MAKGLSSLVWNEEPREKQEPGNSHMQGHGNWVSRVSKAKAEEHGVSGVTF